MHGGRTKYVYERVGMNSRLDALQAVVLEVKLRHLESWHEQRRKNADRYDRIFMTAGAKSSEEPLLSGGLPLRTPHRLPSPSRHIYNQYVIRVPAEARDGVREHLKTCHIGTEIYYPLPLHLQECFSGLGGREGDLPESERAARETIALPIYPELTGEQIDFVAGSVLEALSRLVAPAARSA